MPEATGEEREREETDEEQGVQKKKVAIGRVEAKVFGLCVNQMDNEHDDGEGEEIEEDVEGECYGDLCPKKVKEARAEEVDYMKKIPVFEFVKIEVCMKTTKKGPVTTKWVDVEKTNDEGDKVVRSRLVKESAKEMIYSQPYLR